MRDLDHLSGRFAWAIDHLGMAAAQGPMMIDCGKGEAFKGQPSQAGHGVIDGRFLCRDRSQESSQLVLIHDRIVAAKWCLS